MVPTSVGTHCILELLDCPAGRLNDETFIRDAVEHAARDSRSRLLHLTSHPFQPHGVTAVALLAESHLSVHTWPEHGYAAVDLFTCGDEARPQEACRNLARRFDAGRHRLSVIKRGADVEPHQLTDASAETDLCPAPH